MVAGILVCALLMSGVLAWIFLMPGIYVGFFGLDWRHLLLIGSLWLENLVALLFLAFVVESSIYVDWSHNVSWIKRLVMAGVSVVF